MIVQSIRITSFPCNPRILRGLCLLGGVLVSLLAAGVASGQTASPTGGTVQLPLPLMSAGFQAPSHPVDWSHYQIVEECAATFQRTLQAANLTVWQTLHPNALLARYQDTLPDDPWAPLPSVVLQTTHQCLNRFPVAVLPPLALASTLQLAVAVNADTLVQAIVTRQLATAHGVPARAAVLDSVINLLMSNTHDDGGDFTEHWTPAHVQLARIYAAQVDALGPAALVDRLGVRFALSRPMMHEHDLDAQLAVTQEELSLARQIVATARATPPHVFNVGEVNSMFVWQLQENAHWLTYLKTLTHEDLAAFVGPKDSLYAKYGMPLPIFGKPAPPVTGDFWFGTPTGSPPTVPPPGKWSMIVFVPADVPGGAAWAQYDKLRHLHAQFPDLAFTLVARTRGEFAGQYLADHPEQEAAHLRQYIADSLHLPGALCVIKGAVQHLPKSGHVIAQAAALYERYQLNTESGDVYWFLVDPAGLIVGDPSFGRDLEWYLRRLEEKDAKEKKTQTAPSAAAPKGGT